MARYPDAWELKQMAAERKEREKKEKAAREQLLLKAKSIGITKEQLEFYESLFAKKDHKHPLPIELMRF